MQRANRSARTAWKPGWSSAATHSGFTAEAIVRILQTDRAGRELAQICASEGIPIDVYYVWKLKYSGLTADQVQARRSQEARAKRRVALGWAAAFGIVASGMVLVPWAIAPAGEEKPHRTGISAPATAVLPAVLSSSSLATEPPGLSAVGPARRPTSDNSSVATFESTDAAPASATPPHGYGLQVVASPDREEAEAWVDRLARAGYTVRLSSVQIDKTRMYRVRVGPIPTRAEAEEVARRLEQEGYPTPWVLE